MNLFISSQGTIRGLYAESFDLHALGRLSIRRASHVEPTVEGEWKVDLSPVDGPLLGPYRSRSQALAAETCWIEQHALSGLRHS
ncbi:hypothetical protein SH661x_002878 [Planctomicrobium sp. SH661]|uniref:hypothetical protein n=1 Tax=Planctomicrobium sp. SH661 TaxID=3448124 RepID=UPI003F5C437A